MGKIIEFFWAGTDEIGEICQQKRKGMDYFHDIFFYKWLQKMIKKEDVPSGIPKGHDHVLVFNHLAMEHLYRNVIVVAIQHGGEICRQRCSIIRGKPETSVSLR